MRLFLGLVLLGLGAAGAVAADRLLLEPTGEERGTASIPETEPRPGDPPLVWLEGELEEIGERGLVLRDGEGPRIEVERFAGAATRFYRLTNGRWLELAADAQVPPGGEACVEALLDEQAFLAVRVFLGTGCGPAA
jgi:hypothetical protein